MKWKPLYDKIIVELANKQEVKTKSGFTFTEDFSNSIYTILQGRVIAVGDGRLLQNGDLVSPKVKEGDFVLFSKMQGESFLDKEKEYTILSESNILAYKNIDNSEE